MPDQPLYDLNYWVMNISRKKSVDIDKLKEYECSLACGKSRFHTWKLFINKWIDKLFRDSHSRNIIKAGAWMHSTAQIGILSKRSRSNYSHSTPQRLSM
jgi:hypothetical protein